MKIAYVLNQYPKVSHTFIRREILALRELGAEVLAVSMRGWRDELPDPADRTEQQSTEYVLRGGVFKLAAAVVGSLLERPLRTLKAASQAWGMVRGSSKPLHLHLIYWAEACVVAKVVRQQRCDHLHAHFGTNPAEVAMLAATIANKPFSFTVHGPEEFDDARGLGLRQKILHARFVVAVSSFGRSQLFRLTPLSQWSKIKVVHCGLDNHFLREPGASTPAEAELLCVGRLSEQKGQAILLGAVRDVIDRGKTCSLVLAGDGELRKSLEQEISRLDLGSVVRITGWISGAEVAERILAARCVVLPSFAEGLPVVLMESLALRRPVITTAIAGIPELVRNGIEGWVVPAGDRAALGMAIEDALNCSADQLARMGEAGRVRALERHDAGIEARKLLAHFAAVSD